MKKCLLTKKGSIISKNLPDLKHVVVVSPTNKYDFKSATRHNGAWSFGELEKYGLTPSPKPVVDPEDSFALMFTVTCLFTSFPIIRI